MIGIGEQVEIIRFSFGLNMFQSPNQCVVFGPMNSVRSFMFGRTDHPSATCCHCFFRDSLAKRQRSTVLINGLLRQ